MIVKAISIFWSLIFPSPVLMVLKFWKVKFLVLIRWYCVYCSCKSYLRYLAFLSVLLTWYLLKHKFLTLVVRNEEIWDTSRCSIELEENTTLVCHIFVFLASLRKIVENNQIINEIMTNLFIQFFSSLTFPFWQHHKTFLDHVTFLEQKHHSMKH